MVKKFCNLNCPKLYVSFSFCVYLLLLLVSLPMGWVISLLTAVALHECCHILALKLYDVKIGCVKLYASGAYISVRDLTPLEQIVCAAAGPLGGLCAAVAFHYLPRFALCAFFQSIFNLIPFVPFDGGRILLAFTALLPKKIATVVVVSVRLAAIILLGYLIYLLTNGKKVVN